MASAFLCDPHETGEGVDQVGERLDDLDRLVAPLEVGRRAVQPRPGDGGAGLGDDIGRLPAGLGLPVQQVAVAGPGQPPQRVLDLAVGEGPGDDRGIFGVPPRAPGDAGRLGAVRDGAAAGCPGGRV